MGRGIRQSGAVSLFAVIFGAMLLTIVTIGFMRLMIMDQRQSSNNDLSQSAYDAALAGVEDAKRVVRAAQTGNIQAVGVLNGPINCNMVAASGVVGGSLYKYCYAVRSVSFVVHLFVIGEVFVGCFLYGSFDIVFWHIFFAGGLHQQA